MNIKYVLVKLFFEIVKLHCVKTNLISVNNNEQSGELHHVSNKDSRIHNLFPRNTEHPNKINIVNPLLSRRPLIFQRPFTRRSSGRIGRLQHKIHQSHVQKSIRRNGLPVDFPILSPRNNVNQPLFSYTQNKPLGGVTSTFNILSGLPNLNEVIMTNLDVDTTNTTQSYRTMTTYETFVRSLDFFERKLYMITFRQLKSISPKERQTNGISFVQSALLLQLTLMALTLEVDQLTKNEIVRAIGFRASKKATISVIKGVISSLPDFTGKLKFRYASQLTMWPGTTLSKEFCEEIAESLRLGIDYLNGTETPQQITTKLNEKVESLSGSAIRNTFEEKDVLDGVTAVLTTILFFRVNWRSAPTVLNGTKSFRDADDIRTVPMIKLNDVMGYVDLKEWDAEALEISYSYPNLSLVMLVPRQKVLRSLINNVVRTSIFNITSKMRRMRIAATLPMYTLRMTLLVPNKLQAMGVTRLFNVSNEIPEKPFKLSHMIQRLMFWSEPGHNAYKDDGLEWDEKPEMEILVDRPYIFYVRWRNLTLLNGNFVL